MSDTFCPAPWIGMFYHTNSASVCCVNREKLKVSPSEFRNTAYVQNLKKDFLDGIKPESCFSCWKAEDAGLQSIRQHMLKNQYDLKSGYKHMELRASNLCNFQCIMCNAEDSSEIAKEVRSITEDNWIEILEIAKDLKTLILTGGEPMIIKRYYDLLEYLNEDTRLIIFTNCSVYNPKFVDRMMRLKNVKLQLSIDGVEETAERQRKGSEWKIVKQNAVAFCKLPVDISVHATITKYNIIDVSRFADFLLELYEVNDKITANAHTVVWPESMRFTKLNDDEIETATNQIDLAVNKLSHQNFNNLTKELSSLKRKLLGA